MRIKNALGVVCENAMLELIQNLLETT